ncbi:MAG: hypothetical protein V4489_00155 [Chlamydiota bacterium]
MSISIRQSVFPPSEKRESQRSAFGVETVSYIDSSGDVSLNDTTVMGDIQVGGNFTTKKAIVHGNIEVKGDATFKCDSIWDETSYKNVSVGGSIKGDAIRAENFKAEGDIRITNSSITGELFAGDTFHASFCKELGSIKANSKITLYDCRNVNSVFTEDDVSLHSVNVKQDVFAREKAEVKASGIDGALTCTGNEMCIDGSEVNTVRLMSPDLIQSDTLMKSSPQILELSISKVNNVHFEGGNGEIIKGPYSSVKSAILGGLVKKGC